MPRLFFVNRFFYPDLSATSQMLTDLAAHLAAAGYAVEVVTSRLSYEDAAVRLAPREAALGLQIVRVATTRFGRANLLGRAFDYLSFYLSAFWHLLRAVKRGDVVVAKTDPPLIGVVAAAVARIKGARLVNWLQDVFPEVGSALGVRVLSGPAAAVLRSLRDASLRSAAANVVLGERMAGYLTGRAIPARQLTVIHNWTDDDGIRPRAHAENPLRGEWALADCFVVAARRPSGSSSPTSSPATRNTSAAAPPVSSTVGAGGSVIGSVDGVSATFHADTHHPRVDEPWPIQLTVTRAGRAVEAGVSYEFLFGNMVVAHRSHHTFDGRFSDLLRWPSTAAGYPLTFRAVVTAGSATIDLDYRVQVIG